MQGLRKGEWSAITQVKVLSPEISLVCIGPKVASDTVVMYTDGVTEAMNDQWEQFGTERLEAIVKQHSKASSKELAEHILEEIRQFTSGVAQSDDITLLILRSTQ